MRYPNLKRLALSPFRHFLLLFLTSLFAPDIQAQDPDPASLMPPKIGSLSHINKHTDRVDNGIRTVTWQYSDPGEDWVHKMRATIDIKHPTSGYTDMTYISQYLSAQNWPTHEVTGWPVGLRSSSSTTYDYHTGKAYYNVSVNIIDAGTSSEAKNTADIAFSYILPKIPLTDSSSSQSHDEERPPDRMSDRNVRGRQQREPNIPPDPDSYEGLMARMDASIREEKRKLDTQIAEYERQWREAQAEWERKYPELLREGQELADASGGTIANQLELITPREPIELAKGYRTTFPIRLENKSRYTAEYIRVEAFIRTRDGDMDICMAKKGLFGGKLGPGTSMTIDFKISKREAEKIIQGYLDNNIHFHVKSIIVWNAAYTSRDNSKSLIWENGFRIVQEKSPDSEMDDNDGTLDLFVEVYDPSATPLGDRLRPGQPNYICFTILNLSREEECRLTYDQPEWEPNQKDILYTPYESLYDFAMTPGPMEDQLNNPLSKFTTGARNLIPVYPGEPIQFLARITPSEKFDGKTLEVTLPIRYSYDLKFEGKKYLKTFKSSCIFDIRSEAAEETVLAESGKSSQDTAEDGKTAAESEGGTIEDRVFIDTPLDRLGLYGEGDIDFNIVLINTTAYKLDNTQIEVVLENKKGTYPVGSLQPGLVEEAWTTIPIHLNRRAVRDYAAGSSINDLSFKVKYNVQWNSSHRTPDETRHIWENAFIAPLEAACSGDHLVIGEFYDPVLDYHKTDVIFSWKDRIYQPARCVNKDGNTLHHLWLDSQDNLVTDPQLIDELITAFMIFPHQESSDLHNQADTYRNYSRRYIEDEERYADLSTYATGVQIASEIFSIALGVMYGDLSSAWTLLSGSISTFNAIDLYRNLMSMYTTDTNISSEDIRQLLKQHRLDMGKEAVNAAGHLANMESIWEVGMLIGKNLDLTRTMNTETNFLRRMTLKGRVDDLKTDIKKQAVGIGWSIFNYLEDTGGVARGAIEFTILNKSAYMLNIQLANLIDLAAQKRITDLDELFMIGLYEQMLAKLRYDLADKLQAAVIARKKTMSGKIAIASKEWLYGTDFESELKRIKEDNLHLLNVLEESNRKKIIAIDLEKRFTKRAIRRITENEL